ncbi:MAG TPA: oligosaccharide flippase family protein [Candidatus Dormibacteraeota bacterium]
MTDARAAKPAPGSRLARNIAYNLAGQGLLLALALVAVRLLYRGLGADAFGIILFAQTINAVLVAVFELGIASTVVREVAAHFDDDAPYVRDLLQTFGLIYWIAYAGLALTIFLLAPVLATHWINLHTVDAGTATTVFRILGFSSLLAVPRSLYAAIFRGRQRLGWKNVIDVGVNVLQQAGMIVILQLGGSLFRVAGWMAGTYALWLLVYLAGAGRLVAWGAIVPGYVAGAVQRTLGFSLRMVWIAALTMIHTQADKLVVSKLLPVSSLGFYSFSASIVGRASLVTNAIGEAAYPSLADLHQRRAAAELQHQYHALQDLVTYATLPVFAGIVFVATPLFTYVFDIGVARALLLPTALLCLGSFMNGTLTIPYIYSLAAGRPEIAAWQNVWALALVLPWTVVLTLSFGLNGAAAAWVLYHVFAYVYGVPRLCRVIGMTVSAWSRQLGRVALLGLLTYGTAWLLAGRSEAALPALTAGFVIASVAFAGLGYRLIGPELRTAVRRRIRSRGGAELHAAA